MFSLAWSETQFLKQITLPKIIQISKIRTYFIQNFMELNMKNIFDPKIWAQKNYKAISFESYFQKTSF